jgi:hypothetical protein
VVSGVDEAVVVVVVGRREEVVEEADEVCVLACQISSA